MSVLQSSTSVMSTKHHSHLLTKSICLGAAFVCLVICLPQMYKHRKHPALKYRTIPIYALVVMSVFFFSIAEVIRSVPNFLTIHTFRILYIFQCIVGSCCTAAVSAIGLRYYGLVMMQYVQALLADRRTISNDRFYKRVVAEIRWCKWLSLERTAFANCFIFMAICLSIVLSPSFLPSYSDIKSIMEGHTSNTASNHMYFNAAFSVLCLGKNRIF